MCCIRHSSYAIEEFSFPSSSSSPFLFDGWPAVVVAPGSQQDDGDSKRGFVTIAQRVDGGGEFSLLIN